MAENSPLISVPRESVYATQTYVPSWDQISRRGFNDARVKIACGTVMIAIVL
jgi:hypothetical protein